MELEELEKKYIKEVLFTEEDIRLRLQELAEKINEDYAGKEPLLVSVLKGSAYFLVDLTRLLDLPVSIDFMAISSYAQRQTSGAVRLLKDLDEPIEDRDVLVVEDIIDTGLTLRYLLNNLKARRPRSLRVCTLLDKSVRRLVPLDIAYTGFEIPDVFVVGYGLDFEQKFRNLPYIGVLDIDSIIRDMHG